MKFFEKWLRGVGALLAILLSTVSVFLPATVLSWVAINIYDAIFGCQTDDDALFALAFLIFLIIFPPTLLDFLWSSLDDTSSN